MKLIDTGQVLLDLDDDGVGHLRLNRPEASNGMTCRSCAPSTTR